MKIFLSCDVDEVDVCGLKVRITVFILLKLSSVVIGKISVDVSELSFVASVDVEHFVFIKIKFKER